MFLHIKISDQTFLVLSIVSTLFCIEILTEIT